MFIGRSINIFNILEVVKLNALTFFLLLAFLLLLSTNLFADQGCLEANQLVKQGAALADGSEREIEFYLKATELCPRMAESRYNLGLIYLKKKKYSDARESFSKALNLRPDPDFKVALAMVALAEGDLAGALEQYENILKENPTELKAVLGKGEVLWKQERLAELVELFEKYKAGSDQAAQLIKANLAFVYERQGKLSQGLALLEEANRGLTGGDFDLDVGRLLYKLGRFGEAATVLVGVAKKELPAGFNNYLYAVALLKAAKYQQADVVLRMIKVRDNRYSESDLLLARLLALVGQNKFSEALGLLGEQSFDGGDKRESSQSVAIDLARGAILIKLGEIEQAKKVFEKTLLREPANAIANNNLAIAHFYSGRFDDGIKLLLESLRFSPDNFEIRSNLAAARSSAR